MDRVEKPGSPAVPFADRSQLHAPAAPEEFGLAGGSPWLSVWVQPRATMRWIIDHDVRRHVHLLAVLLGCSGFLNNAIADSIGDDFGYFGTWVYILIAGPVAGLAGIYLGGAFLGWTGRLLGGEGEAHEVRAAIAWGSVPLIINAVLNLPVLVLYGREAFTSATPHTDAWIAANTALASIVGIVLTGTFVVSLGLTVWSVVVYYKCLGEAHRFSVWRAVSSVLLPAAILVLPFILCMLALAVQG